MKNSSHSPPKPHLLVLASTYPRWSGDPEPGFVHELSKRLTSHFQVTVLCPHATGALQHEQMDGVEVIRYRYAPDRWETLVNDGGIVTNLRRTQWKWLLVPGFIFLQAFWAWRLSRRRNTAVIHAHWLIPQGVIGAILTCFYGVRVPLLVTSHGSDLFSLRGRVFTSIKRWVIQRAAGFTVVSNTMNVLATDLGGKREVVSVRPMGVDLTERFIVSDTVTRSQSEILFVGRLVEKKGVVHLINALPAILRAAPAAHLTIAGFGPDEPQLRDLVTVLGLEEKVQFLGAVSQAELPALYQRAAVFVAPFVQAKSGDQEGLGLVTLEAIGCGCPVVVGDVPATHDVFGRLADQVLVPAENEDALAQRVLGVLADPEGTRLLASALRKDVCERFDWEGVATGYAHALNDLIQRRP